jgi:ABC-type phosphate transport system substrate-binding protein
MTWKIKLISLSLIIISNSHAAEIGINQTVSVDTLRKSEVKNIFEGKVRRWSNGSPVVVFALPREHSAHQKFLWEILKMSPEAYEEIKKSSVSNSQRVPIRELESEFEMIRFVALTPGGIGYFNNNFISNKNGFIKIISIID